MLFHIEIANMYLKKFNFLFQVMETPANTKCMLAKNSAQS